MKRSDILLYALLVMFVFLVVVVFTVPQYVLDAYEFPYLLVVAIMGGLYVWLHIEHKRGN